jgi:hypothetical protein
MSHRANQPTNDTGDFKANMQENTNAVKCVRKRFKSEHRELLEKTFCRMMYPSSEIIEKLSDSTRESSERIRNWFKHRRAAHYKNVKQTWSLSETQHYQHNHGCMDYIEPTMDFYANQVEYQYQQGSMLM